MREVRAGGNRTKSPTDSPWRAKRKETDVLRDAALFIAAKIGFVCLGPRSFAGVSLIAMRIGGGAYHKTPAVERACISGGACPVCPVIRSVVHDQSESG